MNFEAVVSLATSLPKSLPPLAVDIDGTLTDDTRALDPRVFPVLRAWPSPVVVATGKSMPYPVGLCGFLGIEPRVIAENGGVVLVGYSTLEFVGDREAAQSVIEQYRAEGHSLGWGEVDLVNRWRETELAVSRESPLEPLERLSAEAGLEVVDTGYAYHVKTPAVTKGTGLERVAEELGLQTDTFAVIGDSTNDAAAFERGGYAIAVANADDDARAAADVVTEQSFGDGFLEAITYLRNTV